MSSTRRRQRRGPTELDEADELNETDMSLKIKQMKKQLRMEMEEQNLGEEDGAYSSNAEGEQS